MTHAIILAGGGGARFQSELPKQFHDFEGKPLVARAIEACLISKMVESVVIVCNERYVDNMRSILRSLKSNKAVDIITGGKTRIESTLIGLDYYKNKESVTLIDANRPLVIARDIDELLDEVGAQEKDYGFYFSRIQESLFHEQEEEIHGVDRTKYMITHTPCVFNGLAVTDMLTNAQKGEYSDGRDIMSFLPPDRKWVAKECTFSNIKITHPKDMEIARFFLEKRNEK